MYIELVFFYQSAPLVYVKIKKKDGYLIFFKLNSIKL